MIQEPVVVTLCTDYKCVSLVRQGFVEYLQRTTRKIIGRICDNPGALITN